MKILAEIVKNWMEEYNPFEDEGLYSSNIENIFLVGSRAKKTNHKKSDWDVAIVYSSDLKKENEIDESALKLTERMHSSLGWFMPTYKKNPVDIQIFFTSDPELKKYTKVSI